MAEKLKIGVIGCGAIAQLMHIPNIIAYEDLFELIAIADTYAPVLDAVGDYYGIEHRFTNWQEMLALDELQAVVICHSGSHRDSVIAALHAGKDVLVEKPLAWNLREAQEVAVVAHNSDQILQMGYHKRYDPAYPVTKEALAEISDLGVARVTVLHPANELGFSPYRIRRGNGIYEQGHIDPGTWESQLQGQLRAFATGALSPLVDEALGEDRKDDERLRLAYGIVTISLIHQIYMIEGFLGKHEKVLHTNIWRDGFSIHSMIQFPNDLHVSLDWHFLSHLKDYREEYLFLGNHQRVKLEFPSPWFRNFPSPVTIQGGDGELAWEKKITVSQDEAFQHEMLEFHRAVTETRQPKTTIVDALNHSQLVQDIIDVAN